MEECWYPCHYCSCRWVVCSCDLALDPKTSQLKYLKSITQIWRLSLGYDFRSVQLTCNQSLRNNLESSLRIHQCEGELTILGTILRWNGIQNIYLQLVHYFLHFLVNCFHQNQSNWEHVHTCSTYWWYHVTKLLDWFKKPNCDPNLYFLVNEFGWIRYSILHEEIKEFHG